MEKKMNAKMILASIVLSFFIGGEAIAANQVSDQELRTRDSQAEEIHQDGRHIRRHVRQKKKREHRRLRRYRRRHHRLNHLRHRQVRYNIRVTVE